MTRVNGNYQQPKTNLRDWKKTHKQLEVGQTLSQPTGDPKLREKTGTIEFPQSVSGGGQNPQSVVTNPQARPSANDIALLNQQNALTEQNEKIERVKRQIQSEEKKLAQMNRDENPGKYDAKAERIKKKKAELTRLYDGRAGIETKIEKTQNEILKANEPAPAGDPVKKSQSTTNLVEKSLEAGPKQGKAWNEAHNSKIETRARAPKAPEFPEMPELQKQKTNSLLDAIMPNREQPVGKNYIAEANEAAKEAAINQQQKVRQGYLDRAHRAEEASKFYGTSQEAMDKLHGFNQGDSDVTKQFRELEAKDIAEQKVRQGYLDRAHKAEEASKFHGTSQEAMDRLHGFNQEESDITKHFRNLEKESKAKAKIATLKKAGKIGLGLAAAATVAYGVYKLFADDDKKAAPVQPEEKQKVAADSTEVKQDTTSVENDTIAAQGANEVESETEAPNAENKSGVTPVAVPTSEAEAKDSTKVDSVATEQKEDAKVAQKENEEIAEAEKQDKADNAKKAEEAEKAEQEYKEHVAEVAENYWKYAQRELIFEHQGEAGYKPSNKEITERMVKIMERNDVELDKDGVHPSPMLKVGDKVKVLFEDEETAA